MGILFKENFENGTTTMTTPELTPGCIAEVTNINPINGAYSGRFYVFSQAAWTEAYRRKVIAGIQQVYVEALVRIDAFTPETTSGIIRGFIDVAGERAMIAYVGIDNARHLVLTYRIVGGALLSKVSAVILEVGVEHKIRLEASAGSSASFRVFLNDVEVTDLTTTDIDNTDAGLISKIDCGVHNAYRIEATVLVDDLLVSDTPLPIIEYTLTISATTGGITEPAVGSYSCAEGSIVTVTAIPQSGYRFDHWELDGVSVSSELTYSVLMDALHSLLAVFTAVPTHILNINTDTYIDTEPIALEGIPLMIEKVT